MTKFRCKTQISSSTVFNGPSGASYISYKGEGFDVFDERDIEAFKKNPRFELAKKSNRTPSETPEVSFKKKLEAIKGLTKKSVDVVLSVYGSETDFRADMEDNNYDLAGELKLSEKQLLLLLNAFNDKQDKEDDA